MCLKSLQVMAAAAPTLLFHAYHGEIHRASVSGAGSTFPIAVNGATYGHSPIARRAAESIMPEESATTAPLISMRGRYKRTCYLRRSCSEAAEQYWCRPRSR